MQQLEIQYFFPLTEQIRLDLDYTPCEEYEKEKIRKIAETSRTMFGSNGLSLTVAAGGTGTVTWAQVDPTYQNFQVLPDGAVGSWQVTPNMTIGRKTKPKFLHRIFSKLMLGWEWKDK